MKIEMKDLFVQVVYERLIEDFDMPKHTKGLNVEFYMDRDEIKEHDRAILNGLKTFLKKENLGLRMHAPILTLDYSNPDLLIKILTEVYKRLFEVSHYLGASIIVTHSEFIYNGDLPPDKQLLNAIEVWRKISGMAEKNGFMLLAENHLEKEPSLLTELIEKVNKKDTLRACFDIGHYNISSAIGVIKCLREYPPGYIKEVHFADNLGDYDSHLALGEGNIDFAVFFKEMEKRKENTAYTIEPRNPDEIEASLQFLRKGGFLIG